MEHSYIEEHNIAERYLLSKLSARERMRFEEHLKNCARCVNLLEAIDGLRMGLQIIAAEEVCRRRSPLEVGLLARIMWLSRVRQKTLLVGVILLIALPMGLVIFEWIRARRELVQTALTAA